MLSEFPKHSRKSLLADGVRQNITNKLRTQEMCKTRNVNQHISGGPKQRNHTKRKFNKHLKDIISNKL